MASRTGPAPSGNWLGGVTGTAQGLNIRDLMDRNIFELSGGEQQKIALASVYTMDSEIYLLDEPSSNLDMAPIAELRGHLPYQEPGQDHPDRGALVVLPHGSGRSDRLPGA